MTPFGFELPDDQHQVQYAMLNDHKNPVCMIWDDCDGRNRRAPVTELCSPLPFLAADRRLFSPPIFVFTYHIKYER